MRFTYELQMISRCPIDHKPDAYDVTIESTTPITVEGLLEKVEKYKEKELLQEDIAEKLSMALRPALVTVVGIHSGVKVTCSA